MMKREKREIGFNFRVDFNLGVVYFFIGLFLNKYVMLYLNCKIKKKISQLIIDYVMNPLITYIPS